MTRLQKHVVDCDVLVAGGGMAGVSAAIAAARQGASVALLQDRPVLGGNASSEIRMHVVGADASGARGAQLAVEAREGGIIEEIRLENCVRNPQRAPSVFDLILYEKCRAEPNLTLLLNTTLVAADVEKGRIRRVTAERQTTEDRFLIAAEVFVDCTGDGRLGVEAGASYREGREARGDFGESLARTVADGKRLGSSLMLQARKHDRPMPFVTPPWARGFSEDELRLRPHATAGSDLGLEYGFWWVEWGGTRDTIAENEAIRDELLAIVLGVWDHIKNGGDHGADHWALEWIGFVPGKRESRRFVGQYTLCQQDLIESRPFDDAIAYGGWPIDLHPPEGVDASDQPPCTQHAVPWLYDIPLRACVSADVENLMFAGRNISATHVAFASTRVMATCSAIGQGVGTAAALAAREGLAPARLIHDRRAVEQIQQQLLRDDAWLIGRRNEDPLDLARQAHVSASSQQEAGPAVAVQSGQTRAVYGPGGAPPARVAPGSHRWMSDPTAGFPATLQLEWNESIRPSRIELILDTALHRVLTFSLADGYTAKMVWGRPQPETLRDYRIEKLTEEGWQPLLQIRDNYQRRRVHEFPSAACRALRVTVESTWGLDHGRIAEVRVYA